MKLKLLLFILVAIFFLSACTNRMENLNSVLDERIIDNANLFSDQEEDSLFLLIHDLSIRFGPQIGIATIDSLNGESIEEFSIRMRSEMKLGRISYQDGLLFAISEKDKIVRIDVGDGLVRIIPDEKSRWINRDLMIPKFKQGLYFDGLLSGLTYTVELIKDKKEFIGKGLAP